MKHERICRISPTQSYTYNLYATIIIWANPRSDLKSTSILFYFHKVVNMQFVKLCALVWNQTMTLNIYMESPAMYTRQKDFEFIESIFIQLTFFIFRSCHKFTVYFKGYESTCNAYILICAYCASFLNCAYIHGYTIKIGRRVKIFCWINKCSLLF